MEFNIGESVDVDMDVHLQWSGAWRLEKQAPELLANVNADDGNRNFDKGDMVNNLWSATIDIDARYKDFGVFLRPRAYYDFAYDNPTANTSPLTNNNGPNYGGPLTATNEFMKETQDLHRNKAEILDAYLYGSFDVADRFIDLRVGRQAVNWGEALFATTGIGTAQNYLDATKLNTPGVELRDAILPTGQAYALVDLPANFSISGYYQWEFKKNRLDEAGSYFSTDDYILDAGRRFIVDPTGGVIPEMVGTAPTVDRRQVDDASDSGQYGAALRYLAEGLNSTEFGLYYINYHEKMPYFIINKGFGGTRQVPDWSFIDPSGTLNYIDDSSYDIAFKEDVKLYGFSFGTTIGDTNVGGEVAYRQDLPVLVEDATSPIGINSYLEADALTATINAIHLLGPAAFWDQLTLVGEVGLNQIYDLGDEKLANDRDRFSWGGTAQLIFDFLRPFPKFYMDIKVPFTYAFAPGGKSPLLGSYVEREERFSVIPEFLFYNKVRVGVGYTAFLNSADVNRKADRDLISAYVKYSF